MTTILKKRIWLAGFGGFVYYLLELLWNGRSHWSMFLLGGLCFRLIGHIRRMPVSLFWQCLLGGGAITAAELGAGLIVNSWLHWNIWDYSALPLNLMGQVCLPFTILWTLLALPALKIDALLERNVLRSSKSIRRKAA